MRRLVVAAWLLGAAVGLAVARRTPSRRLRGLARAQFARARATQLRLRARRPAPPT